MTDFFKIIQTTELNEQAKLEVLDLWNNEYPEKLSHNSLIDFEQYLQNLNNLNHFILIDEVKKIIG